MYRRIILSIFVTSLLSKVAFSQLIRPEVFLPVGHELLYEVKHGTSVDTYGFLKQISDGYYLYLNKDSSNFYESIFVGAFRIPIGLPLGYINENCLDKYVYVFGVKWEYYVGDGSIDEIKDLSNLEDPGIFCLPLEHQPFNYDEQLYGPPKSTGDP